MAYEYYDDFYVVFKYSGQKGYNESVEYNFLSWLSNNKTLYRQIEKEIYETEIFYENGATWTSLGANTPEYWYEDGALYLYTENNFQTSRNNFV